MIQRVILFLLISFFPFFARADFNAGHWQFLKDILVPPNGQPNAVMSAQLDQEVLSHSKTDFSDLRIIDAKGSEVPFVVRRLDEFSRTDSVLPRILNLSSLSGKDTSFVVDLGERAQLPVHNSISIVLGFQAKNFRRQVRVEGSDSLDINSWRVLKDNASIYDYSLEFHVANSTITYPDSTYRYLRITIVDAGQKPLPVIGASAQRTYRKQARTLQYPTIVSQKEITSASEVIVDSSKEGVPTDTAIFTAQGSNFERPVQIFSSSDKKAWRFLGSDTIYQFNTPTFIGSKTTIHYPETNDRYLKFVIQNADSPAVEVRSVTLEGVIRMIAFLANPQERYMLYYGSKLAKTPQYDFASIYHYFESASPFFVPLGQERENPSFALPISERAPWLLPLALGLIVLFLGIVVMNLFRRTTNQFPPSA